MKEKEMEDFFKSTSKSGNLINSNYIYQCLKDYGLSNDEKNKDVSHLFYKWIKNTKDTFFKKSNIHSYPFPNNDWIGFTNKNSTIDNTSWIKLYIPIKYNFLDYSINKILNFLNNNPDIIYDMKVARQMRSDNVVIRVMDQKMASRIINFIDSDKNISQGKNKLNPFLPHIDGIGIVDDRGGSYNEYISSLISSFLKNSNDYSYKSFTDYLSKSVPHPHYLGQMESHFKYKNQYIKLMEKRNLELDTMIDDNSIDTSINFRK